MNIATRGVFYAVLGTLILTPDTLLMRMSGLDLMAMTAWRGVLMGLSMITVWLMAGANGGAAVWSGAGLTVIACHMVHIFMFSLGVAVAPVIYVLMGLATVPIVSALLSRVILGEKTSAAMWVTIALVIAGLLIAILSGHAASEGGITAAILGTLAGLCVAFLVALTFVCFRAQPDLPIALPIGLGALIGGATAMLLSGFGAMMAGQVLPIALTGLVILPLSFLFLSAATRYAQTALVSLVMLLETVLGPFWLWLVRGEAVTVGMLIGGALVIASLASYLWASYLSASSLSSRSSDVV